MHSNTSFLVGCAFLVASGCGEVPRPVSGVESTSPVTGPATVSSGVVIDHTVMSLEGEPVDLARFRGRPMLIVNTASKCGYTPQYEGLQELHETYGERGLVVVGFPSNDFGNQEPGDAEEIGSFCRLNYGVTFPMMAKIHTTGPDQAAVYRALTTESAEEFRGEVRWNFTKFLVDGDGFVVARFDSGVEPLDPKVTSAIENLLTDEGP